MAACGVVMLVLMSVLTLAALAQRQDEQRQPQPSVERHSMVATNRAAIASGEWSIAQ